MMKIGGNIVRTIHKEVNFGGRKLGKFHPQAHVHNYFDTYIFEKVTFYVNLSWLIHASIQYCIT